MTAMLAAELLKVRGRWLPWALWLVLVAMLALTTFAPYLEWKGGGLSLEDFERQAFVLPWALTAILSTIQSLGSILLGIVAASLVGTEYSWGTVRSCLVRGQPRSRYLLTKLLGLATVGLVFLAAAFAVGLIFTLITTHLADQPITLDVPDGPSLPEVPLMFLRSAFSVLPYALVAFLLAELFHSTAAGVGGGLVYVFVEGIILAIFGNLGGVAGDMRLFFVGHHVSAVMELNRIGSEAVYAGLVLRPQPEASDLLPPTQAAIALAAYCVFLASAALWLFQRRDVRS
jgi:ABC-type transport system involved in multi-copper enzyme maturation permease subunit